MLASLLVKLKENGTNCCISADKQERCPCKYNKKVLLVKKSTKKQLSGQSSH